MAGIKAEAKKFLKSKNIDEVVTAEGKKIKVKFAKTIDLVKAAAKNGLNDAKKDVK